MDTKGCIVIPNVFHYDLNIEVSPGYIDLPISETEKVEKYWQSQFTNNPALFNGVVYSVSDMTCHRKTIDLLIEKSNYAHYLYTKDHCNGLSLPCCAVAFGAPILTNDGYYIMGRMSDHTSFPGIIQCIGGGIDEQDVLIPSIGIRTSHQALSREISEEIGISVNFHKSAALPDYFIIRKDRSLFGEWYVVQIGMSKMDVMDVFDHHKASLGGRSEPDQLIAIGRDINTIQSFLDDDPNCVDYLE